MPCYGAHGKAFGYHQLFPEHSQSYHTCGLVLEACLQGYEAGVKSLEKKVMHICVGI